jgi:hypothetical protein
MFPREGNRGCRYDNTASRGIAFRPGIEVLVLLDPLLRTGSRQMSEIRLNLPVSLLRKIKELADRNQISINGTIANALAEHFTALETEEYFNRRKSQGSRAKYLQVLRKVSNRRPAKRDRL